MSSKRPPAPRSSGGNSRTPRPGGRSTRPASGQMPSSSGTSRSGTGRSSGSTQRPAAPRASGSGQQAGAARPNSAQQHNGPSRSENASRPAPQQRTGPQGSRAPKPSPNRAPKPSSQSNKPTGPDTQTVSAYSVGAPLNRNFGFLQTNGARAVTLLIVIGICAVILTPVLRNYFKQYNANNAIKAEISKQQAINEELRNELDRWQDDKYVIAQARERLTFVFPGESPYRVMGWDSQDLEAIEESQGPTLFPNQDVPWYENLWQSVQKTGNLSDDTSSAVRNGTQSGEQGESDGEEPDGSSSPSGSSN